MPGAEQLLPSRAEASDVRRRRGRLKQALITKIRRRKSAEALEKAREIRRVGKSQRIGHLSDGHAGVYQAALGLQQHALMHDLQGTEACQFATDIV